MKKKVLVFALEFFALTIPLTWLWIEYARAPYALWLMQTAAPLHALFGLEGAGGIGPVTGRTLGLVPFAVLMAITPGIPWRRRALAWWFGSMGILAAQLVLLLVADAAFAEYGQRSRAVGRLFPFLLLLDALPFAIWAVVASDFVRGVAGTARGAGPA